MIAASQHGHAGSKNIVAASMTTLAGNEVAGYQSEQSSSLSQQYSDMPNRQAEQQHSQG